MVLQAIAAGYRYGFDIMEATGLPSGTVYPALRRLDRDGFLSSDWEDRAEALTQQRPPRRYYEVSEHGQLALSDARSRFHGLERAVPDAANATPPEGNA
ncbi:MAG: PadR family transcriptional regulator [Acidobacteria bacterium]|nr:PadR family transcriptional regulator [Acidobacteriota bacterium]